MPCRFFQPAGELEELADTMAELNTQGYRIYAGILPRKDGSSGKLDNCSEGIVIWADFDGVDNPSGK